MTTSPAVTGVQEQVTLALNFPPAKARITSIDAVRGIVMLLMAIDHVRVYSGLPAGGPTPGIFFTRWVTHFVAPAFCFLAGTAAYFHGKKLGNQTALAKFLVTRGLWLIFLELTVLRVAWTFNFDFQHYLLAGVIWMLGWCMILLAALLWLPVPAIALLGGVIIAAHNVLDFYTPQILPALQASKVAWLAQFLYFGGVVELGRTGIPVAVLYSIIPWVGVIAVGYAFGKVMERPPERRRRLNLVIGSACVALFLILRTLDLYGDPRPWNPKPRPQQPSAQSAKPSTAPNQAAASSASSSAAPSSKPANGLAPSAQTPAARQSSPVQAKPALQRQAFVRPPAYIRFLNTSKYPASLLFLLMTLGPMFIAIAFSENWHGRLAKVLGVFGRVPMGYYLLHIPLIHVLAILVSSLRSPRGTWWLFTNHPMFPPDPPAAYVWTLPLLYAIWVVGIVLLYFPCAWFANLKSRSKNRWLSYL